MFGIDDLYWIIINSAFSFIALFIISKLLGKKQIAQLEFIDYAIGISLGSIAADWAVETSDKPFYYYLIAISIFFIFALIIDIIGRKGTFFKRILKGKPSTLIYDGKINYSQLAKCKIDINDLLCMLREKNYFDINDVAYAILETSGKLSVLPKGNMRPPVIEDINSKLIEKSSLQNVLIADGKISKSGLNEIKQNKEWLFRQLKIKDKKDLDNIILATYNDNNETFSVHYKNK